jgi:uncharacterized membrane protein
MRTGGAVRSSRLEAFSDAVLAIIITIMVLDLRVPTTHDLPSFLNTTGHGLIIYLLSFVYVAIYWYNHHHLFHLVQRVSGGILWANLTLLFGLSLLPFTTEWMAQSRLAHTPLFVYGLNLLVNAAAYFLLQSLVIRQEGPDSVIKRAVGRDFKGKIAPVLYLVGMLSTVVIDPHGRLGVALALGCYVAAAVMWVIPDRRVDRLIREADSEAASSQ